MKLKYLVMVCIGALICGLLLGGMGLAEELVTREQLLEAAGLTAEDVEGLKIEKFIEDEQITPELLGNIAPESLRMIILARAEADTINREYLLYGDAIPLPEDGLDFARLKRLSLLSSNDALMPSVYIDFGEGSAYYGDGYILGDLKSAVKVTELTGDIRAAIIGALNAAGIDKWEYDYPAKPESVAYVWVLSLEYESGVVRYSHSGSINDAPAAEYELGVKLYNMFW